LFKKKSLGSENIWNSNFIKIAIITTLCFTANQIGFVAYPLFLRDLGADPATIGMSMSILTLVAMFSRPLVGTLTDKKSRRFVMFLGAIVIFLCSLSFAFFPIIMVALVFRSINGLGLSAVSTANMTIATDVLPPSQLKKGLSYFGICETIAGAVGPTLALALVFGSNFIPAWLTAAGCMVIALCVGITLNYEKTNPIARKEVDPNAPKVKWVWKFFEKKAMIPASIVSVVIFANSGIMSFLAPYAADIKLEELSVFYAVQAVSMFLMRIIVAKVIDKIKTPLVLLIPAGLSFATACILISQMTSIVLMIPAAIFYGIGIGIFMATLSVITMSSAAPERRGAASSTFYCMCDIGACVGSLICGMIAEFLGYKELFMIIAIMPVIAIVMSIFIFHKRKKAVKEA